ncbi:hypothetical protein BCV69DRAFT_206499 [Microstroma glucosiphilum]|uniref:Paf1-domain-containing protein n=1 Tax=Pseudomicrostroma glucosiphilum TaxID=1684307 RepID=A0A316U525_9BASI|nr:hypothetical protein BCV69DRAFT_206499 [Pseudomicrostroma glucosiphilum]PWN20336.1 hypothetical protein BCV69DRAFT_206499 [Pseudomicrostroma glucosiphilum]
MSSSRKRTDLIERIRYPNPLPLPPYPPKLLSIDTPAERYADPTWSSRLADSVPFPLVVDGEGGMPLDINAFPELWATDAQGRPIDGAPPPLDASQIHSEDAWLLNPSLATAPAPPLITPAYLQNQHANGASGTATPPVEALGAKDVGWLRRTEYLGADRKAKAEAAVRSARQQDRSGVDVSPSAEATRIEASFAAAEVPLEKLQHPTKKDLKPVESFELLPDFDTWATQYHVLKFSDAPGRHEESRQVIDPRLHLSLLRARPDPFTMRPLVSFFLPTTIPADLSPQEFDELLLADPDAFDEEDRAFFQDQAGSLDDSVREAAVLRREERRRRSGWAADLPQEPEEVEGEDDEVTQEKQVAFSRERAKVTTPYSHQRDYEPERLGGEEEWQRILVLNFSEDEASTSVQPIVASERQRVRDGYKEGSAKKAYYHPITQRTTLRVKRSRRPDAHNADPDYWQSIALTHQELSERDQLKRLYKRRGSSAEESGRGWRRGRGGRGR